MKRVYLDKEVYIQDMIFPNLGVGLFEGNKVYIKNAIPNQLVKVNIKRKKKKLYGKVAQIIKKAEYEIEPSCSVFHECGGCTFQNIDYKKELEIKQNNVFRIFEENGIRDFEFLGINENPSVSRYRNKMEFSFGDTGELGQLCLGMKKRNSYYEVVNAKACNITSEDINKVLESVLEFFKTTDESFHHRVKKTGSLRHLMVRQGKNTGEMLVNIVTTSSIKVDLEELKDILLNLNLNGSIVGILHIINDSVADVIKTDKVVQLYGRDYFYEEILGLKFKISNFSFFQTNSSGAEVLYKIVKKLAKEFKCNLIFDLYCGTGTISQILAESAQKIIGIDIVEEAILMAKENASLNQIENCEFICGDVNKVIKDLNEKPDLIVLDPPREGIAPKSIVKIAEFNAKNIIYISCKASSLGKDLALFIQNGYEVKKVELVDMHSRTYHIETVVLLSRKK